MIKLTEIVATSGQYNKKLEKNVSSYRLRDIFVNPAHVITMRDDEEYNERAKTESMVPGLHKEIMFTRLNLNMGSNITLKCVVTGSPDSVMEKISQKRDQK